MHCNLRPNDAVERYGQKSHFDPLSAIFDLTGSKFLTLPFAGCHSAPSCKISRRLVDVRLSYWRLSKAFTSVLSGCPTHGTSRPICTKMCWWHCSIIVHTKFQNGGNISLRFVMAAAHSWNSLSAPFDLKIGEGWGDVSGKNSVFHYDRTCDGRPLHGLRRQSSTKKSTTGGLINTNT